MQAMEVTAFVLWESRTSMALLEQVCKSLLISLLTKVGFFWGKKTEELLDYLNTVAIVLA